MKELRDLQASGIESEIKVIDDWLTAEECNYLVWAFEYDGTAVMWDDVKTGENHFPRKASSWLQDRETKAAPFIYSIRDRITEQFVNKYYYPQLFATHTYLDGIVDSTMGGTKASWWTYYQSILFLNDNYEDGEIRFTDKEISVTPRMGSLVLFPASERWDTALVQGTAYRLISTYTDVAAYREDDLEFEKQPFIVQNAPKPIKRKSKGCGSCVDKKIKVKIENNQTGEISYVYKTREEWEKMRNKNSKGSKGIII